MGEVKTYPGAWMGGAAVVGMSELRHGTVSRGLVGWLVPRGFYQSSLLRWCGIDTSATVS